MDGTEMIQAELRRYAKAIKLAEADGNVEAANELRRRQREITAKLAETYRAEQNPRGPGSAGSGMSESELAWANVGAGLTDWGMGVAQTLGLATGEDYRDKRALDAQLAQEVPGGSAYQFGGNILPTLAAPVVGGMGGAMALGGAMGALSPTTSDNVAAGKLGNTLLGSMGGGAGYRLANMAAPAGAAFRDFAVQQGIGTAGSRQGLAERRFLDVVGDPADAAALIRRNAAREARIPGTSPTTGQLAQNPEMLGTERALRNIGGEAGEAFNAAALQNNDARLGVLRQNLSGSAEAIRDAARDAFQRAKGSLELLPGGVDPNNQIRKIFSRAANRTEAPTLKAELLGLRARWEAIAAMPAQNAKQRAAQLEQVHQFRMTAFDDALKRTRATDENAGKLLRATIQEMKNAIDRRIENRLTTPGAWRQMMQDFNRGMTRAGQQENATGILDRVTSPRVQQMSNFEPSLQSSRGFLGEQMSRQNLIDEFWDTPTLSVPQRRAVRDVSESLNRESLTRAPDVMTGGSSTAANLNVMRALNNDALGIKSLAKDAVPAAVAYFSHPLLGAATMGQRALAHRAQSDIARRLISLYRDPQAALAVLDRAVRSGQIPPQTAQGVAAQINQLLGASAGTGARLGTVFGAAGLPAAAGAIAGAE